MSANSQKELSFKDKLNVALKYTNENLEKAKSIVSNDYQDLIALKARFKDEGETIFGLFIIYLSSHLNILVGVQTCVSASSSTYNHKPFDSWKVFEQDINKEISIETDSSRSQSLKDQWISEISNVTSIKLLQYSVEDKYNEITSFFQQSIEQLFEVKDIAIQLEIEQTNSVLLEQFSQSMIAWSDEPAEEEEVFSQTNDPYAGNVILKGRVVLAPVRGKDINLLEKGDNIKVLIDENTQKAINIASKLEAYEDGQMKSIVAEVESYQKIGEEHEIYASIAPYILVKIREEENVKVSAVASAMAAAEDKVSKKNTIIVLAFIILVILVAIYLLAPK